MSEKAPSTTYRGIDIVYSEDRNKWTFTLRGVQRWSDTLTNAKAAIDKPAPRDKKPFKQFDAYKFRGYGNDNMVTVTVTSIAGKDYRNVPEVWINEAGTRSKTSLSNLFAINEANSRLLKTHRELTGEIARLEAKVSEMKFQPATLPDDTEMPE